MDDIRRYLNVLLEKDKHAADDYEAEIDASYGRGTYNFPWKVAEQRGVATARFFGDHGTIRIELLTVHDRHGHELHPDATMLDAIRQQGYDFIGKA